MIADTEKLSILSFCSDPAQSFPADSSGDPDCDPIRNSGSRISVQFSHICFQSIFIELDGTTEQTIEFWKIFNWAGWVAWLVAHLFASFPLKLSCYEYSDSQLGDGSHRVKLSSQPGPLPTSPTASSPRPCRPIRGGGGGQPMRDDYSVGRLNCSYFGVLGRNFWYINNVVDDPSVDYYK